eukprot:TRINITY_DN132_c0_g1_i3.p1 TRINITY_DN132_c0_g1~~TRINITY_DN132_c0_g1_i3.p1  ORF type:complete len:394 (+),score=87.26 TRINITY_DN132_c0_g1_i3:304-1485(+)
MKRRTTRLTTKKNYDQDHRHFGRHCHCCFCHAHDRVGTRYISIIPIFHYPIIPLSQAFHHLILPSLPLSPSLSAQEAPEIAFERFMLEHERSYSSREEMLNRFEIFKENLKEHHRLNEYALKTGSTARFGINKFADLTKEEFKNSMLSKVPAVRPDDWPVAADLPTDNLPTSFDWRQKGAVTPVKNQGQCGSCWSFSATGNVEGQWFLAGNKLTSLSEQNLVDCDHECMTYKGQKSCDSGCNGGLQPNAFTYIIKNGGIDTEEAYPYTAMDGTCKYNATGKGASISNFTMVSTDEEQIAAYLVQHGPLAIAADAAEWQAYIGGVFDFPCGKQLDHGILIVGYGTEKNIFGHEKPYWIVKNSWGSGWGKDGYLWIARGKGECGLNTFVSSAIVH